MTLNNSLNKDNSLGDGKIFRQKLMDLKSSLNHLHEILPCLKQSSDLSHYLQQIFELRNTLNHLEHGLLLTHLKCSVSPSIKIPREVILAVSKLSARRQGSIIAIEQKDRLEDYLKGGVMIDAVVSTPILESIFNPDSQLHDGAVFIQDTRVIKAGCILPSAPIPAGLDSLGLGTRHQAAVGLSQISDALVIVVSEEKGWISLAIRGQLYPNLGTSALLKRFGDPTI